MKNAYYCINISKIAQLKELFLSFDIAKVGICFQLIIMNFPMFRLLFSPLPLLFSFLFRLLRAKLSI